VVKGGVFFRAGEKYGELYELNELMKTFFIFFTLPVLAVASVLLVPFYLFLFFSQQFGYCAEKTAAKRIRMLH
jgi:hypothetical protein